MKFLLTNLVLIAVILSHQGFLKELDKGYGIGDYATDFSLPDINGKSVSLADFKDAKGYLVIFTCNTCPYAIAYEDRIIALDKKYKTKGVPVIAINPNDPDLQPADDVQHMKKRAIEKGFTFPYLVDVNQEIFPQYGATKTPHVYLLEKTKQGNVVRYIGTIDDNYSDSSSVRTKYVENAVDAMLSGKEIPLTTTRAIGCSIKSRKR
ncbi:MAG: thioredoxin family protein [Flavobacteriaceae bacterium]|nr:MAG: thioredoxin family protein [Flavobacteriaceae bacterium]